MTFSASQLAGEVMVTVTVKNDSDVYIGFTIFTYKDEKSDIVKEIVKDLVKDRAFQSRFFAKLFRELAKENLANDGKQTEAQGQLQHLGKSIKFTPVSKIFVIHIKSSLFSPGPLTMTE